MAAYRYQGIVINAVGAAIAGAQIYVCNQPANTSVIPPSPLASLFTDGTGGTALANPVTSDGNGNYFLYAATGTYTVLIFDPFGRIPTQIFPDQLVVSPGGGTVTSIALTAPAILSVTGSPLTTSGTIALTLANQNANLVFAGPASGPAAAPTFRALVAADFPAGASAIFTNQAAHTFLAGPTSGAAAAMTVRAMVPSDLPGGAVFNSAASLTFDASVNSSFRIQMSSNVTSSVITNPTARQVITFIIAENSAGGFTFVWPSNVRGASNIQTDANGVNVQSFIYDEVTGMWRATGPGSFNGS